MSKKLSTFIQQWMGFQFSSGGETGADYLKFQTGFRRILTDIAKESGYHIHRFLKNHYCCSAVLQQDETGAFAYVSISDVRFWPEQWFTHVLYRQMRTAEDWVGRSNHYCSLDELGESLKRLYA